MVKQDKLDYQHNRLQCRYWDKKTKNFVFFNIAFGLLSFVSFDNVDVNFFEHSTGLRDKNGNLIFEGDILTDGANTFIVNWYDDMALFRLLYKNDNRETYCLFYPDDAASKYTVIGNIHEETEK